MFVDVLEGLYIPPISKPLGLIPKWNEFYDKWLLPIFDFVEEYLHDNSGLLVMYPASS